jgi:hypothetical protein
MNNNYYEPGCHAMLKGLIRELSLLGVFRLLLTVCEVELNLATSDKDIDYWARKQRLLEGILNFLGCQDRKWD